MEELIIIIIIIITIIIIIRVVLTFDIVLMMSNISICYKFIILACMQVLF